MPICLGDDLQDKEIGAFIINMNWNYILMCTNQRITDNVKNFVQTCSTIHMYISVT